MIDNRRNDMAVERQIAAFLDKNLYSNNNLFSWFQRTDGLEEQLSGSDLLLSTPDGRLDRSVVDEKVASRFANQNLQTFSPELSFIGRNGGKRKGWLLDSSKRTEYYLLGWIVMADIPLIDERRIRYDTDKILENNIRTIDWALVSRKDILRFLEKKGWTLERLERQDEKIRNNGGVSTRDFIDDVSFRYSSGYVEQPINILLRKQTYMDLSVLSGRIEKK